MNPINGYSPGDFWVFDFWFGQFDAAYQANGVVNQRYMGKTINQYNGVDISYIGNNYATKKQQGYAPINRYNMGDYQELYCMIKGYSIDTVFPVKDYPNRVNATQEDIQLVKEMITNYSAEQTMLENRCDSIDNINNTQDNNIFNLLEFTNLWRKEYHISDCTIESQKVLTGFFCRLYWIAGIYILTFSFTTNIALSDWTTFLDNLPPAYYPDSVYMAEFAGWSGSDADPFRVAIVPRETVNLFEARYGIAGGETHGLFVYPGPKPTT